MIMMNAFAFFCKCFAFPKETLYSLSKLLSSLRMNAKFLGGEMQNICERMQKYINIYNVSYFLSITMSLKCLCRGLIVKKN